MSLEKEKIKTVISNLEEASLKIGEALKIVKDKYKYSLLYYNLKDLIRDIDDILEYLEGEAAYPAEEEEEEEEEETF